MSCLIRSAYELAYDLAVSHGWDSSWFNACICQKPCACSPFHTCSFFFPMPLDRVKSFVLNYTCVLFESNIGLLLCLCSLNWTFSIAIIANIIVAVAQPIQFTIVPPSCFILGFLRSPVCDRLILQQALRSLGSISLYLASSGPF